MLLLRANYPRPEVCCVMYLSDVNASVSKLCQALCQRGMQLVSAWWMEPAPQLRPAPRGLEIALLPSPLARGANRFFACAQLLVALELAWIGHWPAAAGMLALATGWLGCCRRRGRDGRHQLRRLLVSATGQLHVKRGNGELVGVRVHPASLCLGRWLLLRLECSKDAHLLLLGPDNAAPAALAALRRRMATAAPRDFD
jgi:hypothetical protein